MFLCPFMVNSCRKSFGVFILAKPYLLLCFKAIPAGLNKARGQRRKQSRSEAAEGGSTPLPRLESFQCGSTRGAHVEGIIMGEIGKSALWRLFEANPNTFWGILILKLSFLLPPLGGFSFSLSFQILGRK